MKLTAGTLLASAGPLVTVGIVGLLLAFSGSAVADEIAVESAAHIFLDVCSGCHTIGGGELTGPDLLAATEWPEADLDAAIQRMGEDYIDPLTHAQIDQLVELLKNPRRDEILANAEQGLTEEAGATLNPASPETGRALFFGTVAFESRGTPCFACHSVEGRGGNLAADLTTVVSRMSEAAITSVAVTPNFPMMKAAYRNRSVTAQEARDLAAFFKASAQGTEAGAAALPEQTGRLYGAAAGLVALVFLLVALAVHGRRAGARGRLVRDSSRRLVT